MRAFPRRSIAAVIVVALTMTIGLLGYFELVSVLLEYLGYSIP